MELQGYITAKTSNNLSVFGNNQKIAGGAIGDGVILDDRGVYVSVPKEQYELLEAQLGNKKGKKKKAQDEVLEAENSEVESEVSNG